MSGDPFVDLICPPSPPRITGDPVANLIGLYLKREAISLASTPPFPRPEEPLDEYVHLNGGSTDGFKYYDNLPGAWFVKNSDYAVVSLPKQEGSPDKDPLTRHAFFRRGDKVSRHGAPCFDEVPTTLELLTTYGRRIEEELYLPVDAAFPRELLTRYEKIGQPCAFVAGDIALVVWLDFGALAKKTNIERGHLPPE